MMQASQGKVLIKIDLTQKTRYKFANGTEIFISRGHEYNLRLDNPNVAEVLYAESIPKGSLVLIHHNATQDSYKLFAEKEDIFSVPEDMVFLYFHNNEWLPNKNFVISKRVFKPYSGILIGIEPKVVPNRMWIEKGEHEGAACVTLKNCDYQIVFFIDGKEYNIIRTRTREIIAEDVELTDAIKEGKYLIGITPKDAKTLKQLQHA